MGFDLQRKPHWSAGSYIDLVLAAVSMQILFFFTAYWIGNYGGNFYEENIREIHYSLRMQMSLGWMMCILAGVGFSILPLIYDLKGFEKTLMRIYVGMNVTGQIAISAGIISRNLSIFNSLTAVGMTLLCASLVCLWSPAMTVFRSKHANVNNVGPFSHTLGAFLPILGIITLLCWILRHEFSSILQFSENLVIDFFFSLALVALIISHLNRRLDWEIIKTENVGKVFGIYAVLLILGLVSGPLHERGDLSASIKGFLQLSPYIFIFLALNPRKIIKQIVQSKSYNPMLVCSVLWLPFVGISAHLETIGYFQIASEISPYYRWVLIFGVAFQVLWGFTEYLHQDHRKIPMKSRKTNLFAIITINVGNAITIYAMFSSWLSDEILDQFPRLGVAMYALAYLSILVYWIKETFFCLYTWHKIPMFYDQYLANPEQGSGYSGED